MCQSKRGLWSFFFLAKIKLPFDDIPYIQMMPLNLTFTEMTVNIIRQEKYKNQLMWGWGLGWGHYAAMTCIYIIVLHKSSFCNQQVELMPCKVWQGRPLRQKKRVEKGASIFAFCRGTDGASVIHMHEAGGCQPITLTLAMVL